MKKDIVEGLTHLFLERSIMRELNHTVITLVLKVVGADRMADVRPISCMNSLCKIYAKIPVDRMGEVVPQLLSKNEATFMPRRLIGEHFTLTREMVQGFN